VTIEEPAALSTETPSSVLTPSSVPAGLFLNTDQTRELPEEPHIVRARFVKLNLNQLMDENGEPRDVAELTFNLFPDVVYTGVIKQVEQSGDGLSWSGYLKDVETSYFTMVYTSGVFMGHFASPLGVYEAVFVDDDLYRVIMIDQTKLPGGEG
jgi:hypothetical protein